MFEDHLKNVFNKANKIIGYLGKFSKAFVRPNLDYGEVLYYQAFNNSFHAKMESFQYNACLAITGTIRGGFQKWTSKIPFQTHSCKNILHHILH